MAKRPEERFLSAGSFGAALSAVVADLDRATDVTAATGTTIPVGRPPLPTRRRRWLAAAAAASVVGLAALAWRAGKGGQDAPHQATAPEEQALGVPPPPPEDTRPSIVVMPFDNLTGEASWDGLGQDATEAILGGLRTMPQVRVLDAARPGNLAFDAKGRGAVWRVTGSLQRMGANLRLAARTPTTRPPSTPARPRARPIPDRRTFSSSSRASMTTPARTTWPTMSPSRR